MKQINSNKAIGIWSSRTLSLTLMWSEKFQAQLISRLSLISWNIALINIENSSFFFYLVFISIIRWHQVHPFVWKWTTFSAKTFMVRTRQINFFFLFPKLYSHCSWNSHSNFLFRNFPCLRRAHTENISLVQNYRLIYPNRWFNGCQLK